MFIIDQAKAVQIEFEKQSENESENQSENESKNQPNQYNQNIKVTINIQNIESEIQNRLQETERNNYLNIIKDLKEDLQQKRAECYIQIETEAYYNFWIHTFNIKKESEKLYSKNDKIILSINLHREIRTFNYESNSNYNTYNYLKCTQSSKLILRQRNQEDQSIGIPLNFAIPKESCQNKTKELKLERKQNEEINLSISWKFIGQNILELHLQFPDGISNVGIKAVLYSRIIIKENDDYCPQTHKKLDEKAERRIENIQKEQIFLFQFDQEPQPPQPLQPPQPHLPPLIFGSKIQSHHIIQTFNDLFKKNEFQIEIPVDLYSSDPQDNNNYNNNCVKFYKKYFDSIRVLTKPYRDFQTYI